MQSDTLIITEGMNMAKTNTMDMTTRMEWLIFLYNNGEITEREEKELDELLEAENAAPPEWFGWCNDWQ